VRALRFKVDVGGQPHDPTLPVLDKGFSSENLPSEFYKNLPADLKISPAAVVYPNATTVKTPTVALPA
jgi:hypothetical protein